ncbi:MAG: DNA repair protein RecO (recombination protein O) [Acidimicrobiales bacterium]
MALYRDEGVVLRTYKLGEADRIIVLYTRNHGKVRAVAKGVRRTKSKFGARLEPAAVAFLQLYEGRNLDIITQAETAVVQPLLRSDLERFGRASVLLEIVDQVAIEGEANQAMYKVLTGALAELERAGNPLVVPAFVAKVLVLEGVQPLLDACVRCGTGEDLVAIDLSEGGVLCREHRQGEPISAATRSAFQAVFEGRVREVLEHTPPSTVHELEGMASRMIEQHLERRLRSSAVFAEHIQL